MRKESLPSRMLSVLLSVALVTSLNPIAAYADEEVSGSGGSATTEQLGANNSSDSAKGGGENSNTSAASVQTASIDEVGANVAKVGNTEYATIDEAIANWTNGTTLTLLSDVTLSDVIQLSSTEHHILDLGIYTMTAASKKDAIQIVNNAQSKASYALDIKADADNPGGITATGKAVVRTTGKFGVQDRPIIRFYEGVFTGSNVVYHSGSNGTNCSQFWFYGGEFNGTVYTNRALNQFYGGKFNGSLQMSVDSSAYTLIAGGTFKQLSNMYGSALNSGKFTIGSSKGVYDKAVYVNDEGYYVVASTDFEGGYGAVVAKTPGTNDYLAYSKVGTEGVLNYTSAEMALKNNESATVTVYADEIDMTGINFKGTIVVPEGETLTIINAPEGLKTEGEGNVNIAKTVAKIGDAEYRSLQDAIKAAQANEAVELVESVVLTDALVVSADKVVTLDLAGKTISQTKAQTAGYEMIRNDGDLTIMDSVGGGKISYTDSGNGGEYVSNTITNRGILTLKSGTVENLSSATVAQNGYPYAIDSSIWGEAAGVNTVIEGGKVYGENYSAIRLRADSETEPVNVTVTGGEVVGTIEVQNPSKNVAGKGALTIKGGKLSNSGTDNVLYFFGFGASAENIAVSVTGGEFAGAIKESASYPIGAGFNSKFITGGTFGADVSAFCAPGFVCEEVSEGKWSVEEDPTYGKVAVIGSDYYATLQAAVDAAVEGDIITLVDDVAVDATVKIASAKKVVLDLNGKTIDGIGNVKIAIMSYGDLTIRDSSTDETGVIKAGVGTGGNTVNVCGGTFTLESGSIYSLNNAILIDEQAATVNIAGGKITAEPNTKNSAVMYVSSASDTEINITDGEMIGYNGILLWNNTEINMTGGAIDAKGSTGIQGNGSKDNTKISVSGDAVVSGYYAAIYHPQGGELTISDNAVLTGWTGVVLKGGNLTISGGTIYGVGAKNDYAPVSSGYIDTGDALYVECYDNSTNSENYGTPTVTVTGGKFVSANGAAVASYANSNNNVEPLAGFVEGGVFNTSIPEAYCSEGYIPVANDDGTYGVKQGSYVVRNSTTGVGYETLQAAFAAAKADDVVTLLSDVTLAETIKNVETITLDLNGKVITGADNNTSGNFYLFNNVGNLTIKDSVGNGKITLFAANERNWGSSSVVVANNPGGTLTVKSGTVEHLGGTSMAYAIDNLTNGKGTYAKTVVDGGTVKSTYRAIRQFLNGEEADNILTVNGGIIEGANKSIWMQDPSTKSNTGNLTVGEGAQLKGDVYLYVTVGSTEWPVEVSIASAALVDGSEVLTGNVPAGYDVAEVEGCYGVYTGVAKNGGVYYESLQAAMAAAQAGDEIVLLADVALGETLNVAKSVTIDGNGYTVMQAEGFVGNSVALFELNGGASVAFENVVFDGIKGVAVMRSVDADVTIDNCVFQNCSHTQIQGMLRFAMGDVSIANSKFLNNDCTMGVTFNFDAGNASDVFAVDNCLFQGNTAKDTALVYYVEGAGASITNSEFINNTVKSASNAATVYLGFQEDCVVEGNLFQENKVESSGTSTRVAGAIFFGYEAEVSGNAFVGNVASNANGDVLGQVCTSTYYDCDIDLSDNYWGGNAPVYGVDYTVQHQTGGAAFVLDSYYSACGTDADGNVVLSNQVEIGYAAQVGKFGYETLQAAFAAAQDGDTITLLSDVEMAESIKNAKKVTLDLNGKVVTGTDEATSNFGLITNTGELTIMDSVGGGKITLEAVNNNGWNRYSSVISNNPGGVLTVNGGTIEHLGGTDMAYGIDNLTNGKGTYAETVINGGTVKSTYRAIRQFLNGVEADNILTVNGGIIEGANKSIWMQSPSANANEGELTVVEAAQLKGDVLLSATAGSAVWPVEVSIAGAALVGGSKIATSNTPDGYVLKEQGGNWSIEWHAAYITSGRVTYYYDSLKAAIDDAQDGETITLLAKVELTDTLKIAAGKVVTLDLNGKRVIGTPTEVAAYAVIANEGVLTIEDNSSAGTGAIICNHELAGSESYAVNTILNAGMLAINGGTIENVSTASNQIGYAIDNNSTSAGAVVAINGGAVKASGSNYYDGIRMFCNSETNDNSVTVAGGSVSSIWMQNPSDGKTDKNTKDVKGSIAVTGGEVGALYLEPSSNFVASVTGGHISAVSAFQTSEGRDLVGFITGGTFGTDVSAFVAEGFVCKKQSADGPYGIVKGLEGKGTEESPYLISTVEELEFFRASVNAGETKYNKEGLWVALGADIDMGGTTWTEGIGDGHEWSFDGCFDGNGYAIKNLTIEPYADDSGYVCGGLFGYIYGPVVIRDLVIENPTIVSGEAGHNVGILVGFANKCGDAKIENVTVEGNIEVDAPNVYGVGGIVGYSYAGAPAISGCSVVGEDGSYIKGLSFVGGIAGYAWSSSAIAGCSVENVDIIATNYSAGGIAGIVLAGSRVSYCEVAADVKVSALANAGSVVGAIASDGVVVEECDAAEPMVGGNYSDNETVQARIGDKYYATLQAAMEAAEAGETVVLLTPYVVEAGESVILDLAGKTIRYESAVPGEDMITNRGNLTIMDSGTDGEIVYVNTDGTASNVTVSTISCEPGSILTVKSGSIKNKTVKADSSSIYPYAIDMLTNGNMGDVNVIIEGGKVHSDYMAIRQFNNGDACKNSLKVIGGEITAGKRAIQVHFDNDMAYTAISGGIIKGGDYSLCLLTTSENLVVEGGDFKGSVWYSGDKGFISGGTFDEDVSAYCVEGYVAEDNGDGIYTVAEGLEGKGTEESPYLISNIRDLTLFRDSVNKGETKYNADGVYVALDADIDMSGVDWSVNIGDDCNVTFDGIFDGQNHTISNLTSTETAEKVDGYICSGLFGAIAGNAVVKNLTIENVAIDAGGYVGKNVAAVVGFAWSATGSIENVAVKGDIKINAENVTGVGGIVGYDYYGKLDVVNCSVVGGSESLIAGSVYVGGIIGYASENSNISGNRVENASVSADKCSAAGIAGIMLATGKAEGNVVKNVALSAGHVNWKDSAAIVVGTMAANGITVSGTEFSGVTANGETTTSIVGSRYAEKPAEPVGKVEARVGDRYYATLQDAIDAAQDGETVTLATDVETAKSVTVAAGRSVVLDLAGRTYAGTDTTEKNFGLIQNNGTLTINDSVGGGKMTVEATIDNGTSRYSAVVSNNPGGTLTVNGGMLQHLGGTYMAYGIDSLTNGGGGDVSVTINGGVIESTYRGIRQFLNSDSMQNALIINGGEVKGVDKSVFFHDPSTKANNGVLTVGEDATLSGDVYLFVTAGSTEWPVEISIASEALAENSTVVSKNVPEGYAVAEIDQAWTVVERVAYIETTRDIYYYETLEAAIEEAKAGETITLATDIVLASPIEIAADKQFVLDLNGKNVSFASGNAGDAMITNNGDLTICDTLGEGSISYKYEGVADSSYGKGNYTIYNNGTLTIEGGTVENTTAEMSHASYAINTGAGATLTVNGGQILNLNGHAVRQVSFGIDANAVVINGGYIEGTRAIQVQLPGGASAAAPEMSLTINGGELKSNEQTYNLAVYVYSAGQSAEDVAISVNGGTINGNIALNETATSTMKTSAASVSNGVINGEWGIFSYADDETAEPVISITGGKFATEYSEMYSLDDGYMFQENADGMYDVVEAMAAENIETKAQYSSVSKALADAEAGETVQLLVDATEDTVLIYPDITLDLNGKTLTATYVSAFKGADVVDGSVGNAGLLNVARDGVVFSSTNAQLPVWTGDAYMFASVQKITTALQSGGEGYTKFGSKVYIESAAHQYLKLGYDDSGVKIVVRLSFESSEYAAAQDFFFNDEFVTEYFNNYSPTNDGLGAYSKVFVARIQDLWMDESDRMTADMLVVSDTGVEIAYPGTTKTLKASGN